METGRIERLDLSAILELGKSLGELSVLTEDKKIIKRLDSLYEQWSKVKFLPYETASEIFKIRSELREKVEKHGFIGYEDKMRLDKLLSSWALLASKKCSKLPSFKSAETLMLNPKAVLDLAFGDHRAFFEYKEWDSLPEISRSDLIESARCMIVGAWNAAAMAVLRSAEAILRDYYLRKTGEDVTKKNWGHILDRLRSEYREKQTLLGFLDFLRDRRNETQHPEKSYSQREAEEIFMTTLNGIKILLRGIEELR